LRQLIRQLARQGTAVLLTDHNVIEALRACDRAFLLVDGSFVEEGTAADLVRSSAARALYFGDLWQEVSSPVVDAERRV
jgi:ABC-type lipopolysaccharide export system ATPase subunit